MFDKYYMLAMKVKNEILTHFIHANINVFFDKEQNEFFISTQNKDLYYSDEYEKLIFEINQNTLWGQGIFNFYFVLDVRAYGFDKTTKEIPFFLKNETAFTPYNTSNIPSIQVDNHIDMNDFALAA